MTDKSIQIVVAGLDGSEQSIRAAEVAVMLARTAGASLHLVTVVRPPEGWWGIVSSPPPASALGNALADAQRLVLDKVTEELDLEGIDYETVEEIGDPSKSLVAYCQLHDAGLLVVGSHGAGLFDRMGLGSVTHKVLHAAPCPVVVVP